MKNNLFLCSISFDKTMENGFIKRATEQHVVDALNFIEAEERIIKEMSDKIGGEFNVTAIRRIHIVEILSVASPDDDNRWYRVKVATRSIDETKGTEKEQSSTLLIHSESLAMATAAAKKYMSIADFRITAVTETKILDFFEYQPVESAEEEFDN